MDVYNRVEAIVLAGKEHLRFRAFDKVFEVGELRSQLIADRLTFAGKVDQGLDIVDLTVYVTVKFDCFFESGALLKNLTGALLIIPKTRVRNDLLQVVKGLLFSRSVKGTSALPDCEFSPDQIVQ
jgi:hypothetical protein